MRTNIRRLCHHLSLLLVLLAAMHPAVWVAAVQEDEPLVRITQVDNSRFPQVTVYVSVTNAAGEPVGVDPGRIQIMENSVAMQPDNVGGSGEATGEVGNLTTLLVIDISGSMNESGKLQSAKDAANAYVKQMRPGDKAGLVTFNTQVAYVQPITADPAALAASINNLKAQNDTAMYDALSQAVQILKDVSGRKAVIVLTDGLDNVSKTSVDTVIEQIGPSGLSISTIGLGNPEQSGSNSGLDEAGLRTLAERAGGVYGYANDPATLQSLYERYARALQSEYQITYTSPSALRDGANRTLTVSLATEGGSAASAEAKYNPGGVLPEVGGMASWPLFGVILAGLLLLLFVPLTLGNLLRSGRVAGKPQKARVRLK
jgi:VWFA-related protein